MRADLPLVNYRLLEWIGAQTIVGPLRSATLPVLSHASVGKSRFPERSILRTVRELLPFAFQSRKLNDYLSQLLTVAPI
jgi:hypothetical protein